MTETRTNGARLVNDLQGAVPAMEFADKVNVPYKTLYGWLAKGKIPGVKLAGRWFMTETQTQKALVFLERTKRDINYIKKAEQARMMREKASAFLAGLDKGGMMLNPHLMQEQTPDRATELNTRLAALTDVLKGIEQCLLELATRAR